MNLNNKERNFSNGQYDFMQRDQRNANLLDEQITKSVRLPMQEHTPKNNVPNNVVNQQIPNMINNQMVGFGQKTIPMTVNQLDKRFNNMHPYQNMMQPQMQQPRFQQPMQQPMQQPRFQQPMQQPNYQMNPQQFYNQELYNNSKHLLDENKYFSNCQTHGFHDKSIKRVIELINTIKSPANNNDLNYRNNFNNHNNMNQPTVHQQYISTQKNILTYEQAISFERLRDKLISLDDLLRNDGISRDTYKKIKTEILLKEV